MPDNALIDAIENILLTPLSDFYVAKILYDANGDALDPRTVEQLTLNDLEVAGVSVDLTIKQFAVHGLSNVDVVTLPNGEPAVTVTGDAVTFDACLPNTNPAYDRPPDVPNQVQAAGDLLVSIGGSPPVQGAIAVTINHIDSLTGTFTASEAVDGDLETLSIDFTAFEIAPVLSTGNMTITVTLPTAFNNAINVVLNRPANQQQLIDDVNEYLNQPEVLEPLSQQATLEARKALADNSVEGDHGAR